MIDKVLYNNKEFTPSEYQKKIFENIVHGTSNMVINAVAGSGKSTTIVNSLRLIPEDKNVLFIAFNKDIVEALKEKVGYVPNVHITTYHSLGYSIVTSYFKTKPELDEYKYSTYINLNLKKFLDGEELSYSKEKEYRRNLIKLVDYARYNIAQSKKEIENVAKKYNILTILNECEVTMDILQWGQKNTNTIDYTDMVWLPYELDIKTYKHKYNWIFVDEAQDSSPVQQELFKKCFKRGARFCAVGDSSQCINAWAGADIDSFKNFLKMPNTKEFQLPISYRCPVNIINEAKKFVPNIEASPNAIDGEIKYNVDPYSPKPGDMVLCRNTYPLVKLYSDFLRINKKSYIRGKDIGEDLINTINSVSLSCEYLNKSLIDEGLFRKLYSELFKKINILIEKNNMSEEEAYFSAPIMEFYDTISSLEILSDNLTTVDELIAKIRTIFMDGGDDAVCLSTIHKSKGLEADNVYILAKSLMPSMYAHQEWEKISEENLEYVAITRAKKTLQYIDENKFKIDRSNKHEKEILKRFETIKNLLGTKPMKRKINITIKPTSTGDTKISKAKTTENNGKRTVGALKFGNFLKK